jgi:flavorubredoxin
MLTFLLLSEFLSIKTNIVKHSVLFYTGEAMKFWPQKKWKQILLIAILAFIIVIASVLGYILIKINNDYISGIEVLNADSTKSALIIYHPGLSSFMKDITYRFADGLTENGWRVEITTASSQAPTDLSGYSLLVLGSPVYADGPSPTIKRHLERIDDLMGIDTVILVTSAGSQGGAEISMQQTVEEYNGSIELVLSLFTMAPNDGDPLDIAEQAGRNLVIA